MMMELPENQAEIQGGSAGNSIPPSDNDEFPAPTPPSPPASIRTLKIRVDYSQWHEICRPVVVSAIQGLTRSKISDMTQYHDLREKYLMEAFGYRIRLNPHCTILTLSPFPQLLTSSISYPYALYPDIDSQYGGSPVLADNLSSISVDSHSSSTSIASQVSDSNANDVQQSAEMLLRIVKDAENLLMSVEKGSLAAKFKVIAAMLPLRGEAKTLWDSMKNLSINIQDSLELMGMIGLGKPNVTERTIAI